MTDSRPHVVYRLYDSAGRLLYVGSTCNLARRLAQHESSKPWWGDVSATRVEHFADKASARDAEQAALVAERPLHNLAQVIGKSPRRTIRVSDDLWDRAMAKAKAEGKVLSDELRKELERYMGWR